MNSETGKVIVVDEHELPPMEREKWVQFDLGETLSVKGIDFVVHDVSDQRLVLKFKKK